MGKGGQHHTPAAFPSGNNWLFYRRLGGPQGRPGWVRKISPTPGLNPRTVQSVASRYTAHAIPANSQYGVTSRNTYIIRVCLVSTSPALYKTRTFITVFTCIVAGPYP